MSASIVVLPLIAWQALTALAAGTTVTGIAIKTSKNLKQKEEIEKKLQILQTKTIEIPLDNKIFLKEKILRDDEIKLPVKKNISLSLYRDIKGKYKLIASGKMSEQELIKIAKNTFDNLVQQYVKENVLQQLKKKGFSITKEEVCKDNNIRLVVRKWG